MSYSNSPPPKGPPPPYSPYPQNSASPSNNSGFNPPPAKRARISPDPRSPQNGTPVNGAPQHGLPNGGAYGNPYAQAAPQNPYSPSPMSSSPQTSFNIPQTYKHDWGQQQRQQPVPAPTSNGMRNASPPSQQSKGAMPPPPRPNKDDRDDRVDVSDIGDSLYMSGINLKEEEQYMYAMYHNRHGQNDSFSTNQNTSFGSSTAGGNNSFNMLTQGTSFGSQEGNGVAAGTMGRTRSQDNVELEHRKKREAAARAKAERDQYHLNNQFLLGNNVRKRLDKNAHDAGVMLNVQGLFVRQPETNVMVNDNNSEGIVAVGQSRVPKKAESVVNQGTSFDNILSLISIAAKERVRGLLEESHALARARRYGDHGRVVPPEFSDVAVASGKQQFESVLPQNISGTSWDSVPDSDTENHPNGTPTSDSTQPQVQPTISFQSAVNARLREIATADKTAETARVAKREKRKRAAEASAAAAEAAEADPLADTPAMEATSAEATPATRPAPKLTKKEAQKAAKEKNTSEHQMQKSTNQTAALMSLGNKRNKYRWMNGGEASTPTNRYAKNAGKENGTGSGTATPAADGGTKKGSRGGSRAGSPAVGAGDDNKPMKEEVWGDWREDGGIQVRDWILVLERDGKERKALEKIMSRLQ